MSTIEHMYVCRCRDIYINPVYVVGGGNEELERERHSDLEESL
jgi:hypothetical protein